LSLIEGRNLVSLWPFVLLGAEFPDAGSHLCVVGVLVPQNKVGFLVDNRSIEACARERVSIAFLFKELNDAIGGDVEITRYLEQSLLECVLFSCRHIEDVLLLDQRSRRRILASV